MFLYSTTLLIEGRFISYEVYMEGGRIFYKPFVKYTRFNVPLFWVSRVNEQWVPMNFGDESFIKQVQEDIFKHKVEIS